jgi:hypothetical protein
MPHVSLVNVSPTNIIINNNNTDTTTNNNPSSLSMSMSSLSSLSPLQLAAKGGMFVKLDVNDGSATALDIPVKNLIQVNPKEETLSNTASYTILRHCALSELFKYSPNREIPNYAWRNFATSFTSYQNQTLPLKQQDQQGQEVDQEVADIENQNPPPQTHIIEVKCRIRNNQELTQALEEAAMKNLMDDNDNIILHIHCEFINQYQFCHGHGHGHIRHAHRQARFESAHLHYQEAEKIRREATIAADHVVKVLKKWIHQASIFMNKHTHTNGPEDFVVVTNSDTISDSNSTSASSSNSNSTSNSKNLQGDDDKDGKKKYHPMEWTTRFIQVLLLPENTRANNTTRVKSNSRSNSRSKSISKSISNNTRWNQQEKKQVKTINHHNNDENNDQLVQFEELLDVVTVSVINGFFKVSKFIQRTVEEHHTHKQQRSQSQYQSQYQKCDSLSSLSQSPSLAESASAASLSSTSACSFTDDEELEEQGVEIIFDPTKNNSSDSEEWKIFFGESKDEDGDEVDDEDGDEDGDDEVEVEAAVMITNPCDVEVISVSSSEKDVDELSFEEISEGGNGSDDESWAMFSDDE